MAALRNELDYQKQAGSKTGAAALEFAIEQIDRLQGLIADDRLRRIIGSRWMGHPNEIEMLKETVNLIRGEG